MNILEIAIFLFTFIYLVSVIFFRGKKLSLRIGLIGAGIIFSSINLLLNGYRWQMVPVYVFLLVLFLIEIIKGKSVVNNKGLRISFGILGFLLFTGCLFFPFVLPVVDLPEPTGEYAVGTASFRLKDENREEIFSENPDDVRNILISAWYPANVDVDEKPITYWDNEGVIGEAFSLSAEIGTFWYSHLSNVKTNSYRNATISSDESTYPVLIYSHSFVGLNTENTMLFEELASQGYIVLSVAHPYESVILLFPDGEQIYTDYEYINQLYDSNGETEVALYNEFENAQTVDEKQEILRQILSVDEVSTHMMHERTKDVLYLLDQLENVNNDSIFQTRMDIENIGVFGWSFGGATALDVCIIDDRCKAVIDIDGWPYGEEFNSDIVLNKPLLVINSESYDESESIIGDMVFNRSQNDAYQVKISGAEHNNFWDFPLFFEVYQYFGYWGPIDAERLLEIENMFIGGFFDQYLKEKPSVNFDEVSEIYPEAELNIR